MNYRSRELTRWPPSLWPKRHLVGSKLLEPLFLLSCTLSANFSRKKKRRDLKLKYKLVVLNHSFFVLDLESSPLFLIHLSKEQINIASASSGMVLWALSSIISYLSMIYYLIQFPHPPTDICLYCFIPLVNLLSIARFSLLFF